MHSGCAVFSAVAELLVITTNISTFSQKYEAPKLCIGFWFDLDGAAAFYKAPSVGQNSYQLDRCAATSAWSLYLVVGGVDKTLLETVEDQKWNKTDERSVGQQQSWLAAYSLQCYHGNIRVHKKQTAVFQQRFWQLIDKPFRQICMNIVTLGEIFIAGNLTAAATDDINQYR